MTVERVPFSRMYGTLDEAKRVLDLRMDGYSTSEIAEIVGSDAGQIRCLFKSISEEIATEVTIAEKTEWGVRDTELLLQSIWNEVAAAGIGIDEGPVRHIETARARMAEFRQEWYLAGTSTEPVDRVQAERAIVRMYSALNVSPPRFVWCDSPMTAQLVLCILGRRRFSRRTALWSLLKPAVRDALGPALRPSPLGIWLGAALRASGICLEDVLSPHRAEWRRVDLSDSLSNPARQALLAAAREDPVWGSLRANVVLESPLVVALSRSMQALNLTYRATLSWGEQNADWIETFLYYRDVLGIRYAPPLSERLDWWADLVRSCMWWWPYRQFCIVSERPSEVHTADGRHLHNDAGPAVRFRDGWCVWAIDGVVVDEQVVLHPETQSLRKIRGEPNTEVKRIRIERYGWDRYLAAVSAVLVDRRRNDIEATHETLLHTPDNERVLVLRLPVDGAGLRLASSAQCRDLWRGPDLAQRRAFRPDHQ